MLQRIIIILIISLLACCSHNGGGIGFLWGTWKLESIEINGEKDAEYKGNCFWKFQQDVVCILIVNDELHERSEHYGTWEMKGNDSELVLYFNHHDDNTSEGTGVYSPPKDVYITQEITFFEISRPERNEFFVSYNEENSGLRYTYHLVRY